MITKCKGCGAEIMFVTTPSGKQQPVNLPAEKRWVKDPDGHIYSLCNVYTSHSATCLSRRSNGQTGAKTDPIPNISAELKSAGKNLELYEQGVLRHG